MCGIAAILLHPQDRSEEQWCAIRDVFTRNLIFNEERGRAATGLAVANSDGNYQLLKLPIPASEFIHTQAYLSLLESLGPETVLILGHTRLPTKGDPVCNANNHPLQTGPVIGIHNGQIHNDDALFEHLGYARQAHVDSEIIFRMLEAIPDKARNGRYLSEASSRLQLLIGQFTFIAWDQRQPLQLLVLKHKNPLCVHYQQDWNAIVFSSRYIFLRKAFGKSILAEALSHDQLLLFHVHTMIERGIQPQAALEISVEE